MNLLEFEQSFADAVMTPLTIGYRMRKKAPDGTSLVQRADKIVKPNTKLSSFERLEIYNRQYWFRVLSVLAEDFPGLQAVIGKKKFESLSRAYLEANPSRSFTLRNLGSSLEAWLRENPSWAGDRRAVALDVVRLEWAYVEAFDNGEEPALTPADAAELTADSTLSLQPHVRLLQLSFPVDDFVIGVHRRQTSSGIASNAVTKAGRPTSRRHLLRLSPSTIFLAVHRFDHSVYYKRLMPEAFSMLCALRGGLPLGTAIESAFENSKILPADYAGQVQQWFATWAEFGWFCRPVKRLIKPTSAKGAS